MRLFGVALLKLLLPFAPIQRGLRFVMHVIAESWIAVNKGWMRLVGRTDWQVQGLERFDTRHSYLVTSNHQSWVDILVLQYLLNRRLPITFETEHAARGTEVLILANAQHRLTGDAGDQRSQLLGIAQTANVDHVTVTGRNLPWIGFEQFQPVFGNKPVHRLMQGRAVSGLADNAQAQPGLVNRPAGVADDAAHHRIDPRCFLYLLRPGRRHGLRPGKAGQQSQQGNQQDQHDRRSGHGQKQSSNRRCRGLSANSGYKSLLNPASSV